MSKKWGKEDELKQLKSDLAALDRKIQAEIAPKPEQADSVENKKAEANTIDTPSTEAKKTMVAEPSSTYNNVGAFHRGAYRPAGL